MNQTLKIISPVDGSVYAERPLADDKEVLLTLMRARAAQAKWREVPVAERVSKRSRTATSSRSAALPACRCSSSGKAAS